MATKNIAGITAKLGLDVTGVTSALKQIETKSKAIAKEMAEVDKSLKFNPESVVLAAQKQELLAEAIKNTEDKLKELESVQKKTDNARREKTDFYGSPFWATSFKHPKYTKKIIDSKEETEGNNKKKIENLVFFVVILIITIVIFSCDF